MSIFKRKQAEQPEAETPRTEYRYKVRAWTFWKDNGTWSGCVQFSKNGRNWSGLYEHRHQLSLASRNAIDAIIRNGTEVYFIQGSTTDEVNEKFCNVKTRILNALELTPEPLTPPKVQLHVLYGEC